VPKALAIRCPCGARRHNWLKSWQKSIGHADFGYAAALELEARSALRGERDIIRRSPKASRLLLRTALEHGTAGGAKVATVMGHARPDTANVRHVLLAEPHRVRFAGRALLRGPLLRGGGPGREHEREAQERRSGRSEEKLACKLLEGVDGSLRGLADLYEVTVRITHVAAQFVAVIIERLGEELSAFLGPLFIACVNVCDA